MKKHVENEHKSDSNGVRFEWGLCGKFAKPLYRQLNEAISINNEPIENIMSTKNEYFHLDVKKIKMNNDNSKYQCKYCGRVCASAIHMTQHENEFHTEYQCHTCEYKAFGKKDLMGHKMAEHQINK